MKEHKKIVVAFSGGLDTSYLTTYLKETTNAEIITVSVNCGGWNKEELVELEKRSKQLGAHKHINVDGQEETYEKVIKHLIRGNVLKSSVYPLCVSAERITQAEVLIRVAGKMGATAIAHGSTGAGNDQVRFDVAIHTLKPEIEVLTPIRKLGLSREEESNWLRQRNIEVSESTSRYSINAGMWGVTIGGGETHDTWKEIPPGAWPNVIDAKDAPTEGMELTIDFDNGLPVAIDKKKYSPVKLLEKLSETGASHGVGRGIHTGDTIMGIKGRIAFEAPAAFILIKAHRELEKIILSKWQMFWKDKVADFYGMIIHEGMFYDPVRCDIEKMIESSQQLVSGKVRVCLKKGIITVTGVKSENSLMDLKNVVYGETQNLWNGRDAEGFTRIYGMAGRLYMGSKNKK